VLGGLTRVRAMQLNDAHIYCTADQAAGEAVAALAMIGRAYRALGIEPASYRLSLPGPGGKYAGDPKLWQRSADMLTDALGSSGLPYQTGEGEAAFYGPKIDVQVADRADREATLSTIQIDFYGPERFDLHYIAADGGKHRPVIVHRSIVGSMERAVGHLTEVHGGAFPGWLAPVQLAVLPVTARESPQAAAFADDAEERGLRVQVAGAEGGSLGSRIRDARLVPYQAIIGEREAAAGQVALRLRDGRQLPALPSASAIAAIAEHLDRHSTELWDDAAAGGVDPGRSHAT
jgi:threonyl-tRNA synthetase